MASSDIIGSHEELKIERIFIKYFKYGHLVDKKPQNHKQSDRPYTADNSQQSPSDLSSH